MTATNAATSSNDASQGMGCLFLVCSIGVPGLWRETPFNSRNRTRKTRRNRLCQLFWQGSAVNFAT